MNVSHILLLIFIIFHHIGRAVGSDIDGTTNNEKTIIFTSFGLFVVGLIVLHCCLKHRKMKEEERRRDFMDYDNYVTLTQHGRVVILPVTEPTEDVMFSQQESGKMWF